MHNLKTISAAFAIALLAITANAQVLEFDKNRHDFGTISETDSTALCTFTFCNASSDTLYIYRVEAPCYINAEYAKGAIAPDMSDKINISVDLAETNGKFDTPVYIYGNFPTFALNIRGRQRVNINYGNNASIESDSEYENDNAKKSKKQQTKKERKKRGKEDNIDD